MSEARLGAMAQQIRQLAGVPASELSDAQLLDGFCSQRDEGVFAALVARHGPMVLNTCRRVVGNEHDADDAFQATFALLAVKAASIRNREALGPWLHTAAVRIASRARDRARRRGQRERQVLDMIQPEVNSDSRWHEVQPIVDEEIERLPAKYREPVVLRYLQGKNTADAAREMGCPQGSLTWRLSRALDLLRQRLTRRGVLVPSAAALAALLETNASRAVVPAALAADGLRTALQYSGGQSAAVSAEITILVQGALRTMMIARWKLTALLGLASCLLAVVGLGLATAFVPQDVGEKKNATPPVAKGKTDPPGLPLEIRLIARVDKYKIQLTDQEIENLGKPMQPQNGLGFAGFAGPAAPRVDLVLEIKNTSDKDIEIWSGGDAVYTSLTVEGPGVVTIAPQRFRNAMFVPPRPLVIAAGKTFTQPVATFDTIDKIHYWTKPGDYKITLQMKTALLPAPKGAKPAPEYTVSGVGAIGAPNAEVPPRKLAGFGLVTLTSSPALVTVTK
ncbi:MAG: RNA polymerase sigma factor [Gemmataceae bacterium]